LENTVLRPLPGVVVSYQPDGFAQAKVSLPEKPGPDDAEVIAWLNDVKLIASDIFDGKQYALKGLVASI
jgi:hypothetical protein